MCFSFSLLFLSFYFFLLFSFLKNERNEFSIDFIVCFESVVNNETIRENNGTFAVSYVKEVFYVNKMTERIIG